MKISNTDTTIGKKCKTQKMCTQEAKRMQKSASHPMRRYGTRVANLQKE